MGFVFNEDLSSTIPVEYRTSFHSITSDVGSLIRMAELYVSSIEGQVGGVHKVGIGGTQSTLGTYSPDQGRPESVGVDEFITRSMSSALLPPITSLNDLVGVRFAAYYYEQPENDISEAKSLFLGVDFSDPKVAIKNLSIEDPNIHIQFNNPISLNLAALILANAYATAYRKSLHLLRYEQRATTSLSNGSEGKPDEICRVVKIFDGSWYLATLSTQAQGADSFKFNIDRDDQPRVDFTRFGAHFQEQLLNQRKKAGPQLSLVREAS